MNRDIEFRGKHIHILKENEKLNGTWVYGYLCDESYIFSRELGGDMLVDKNTIGQYTGLKDKNGKKIFEGDIIKYTDEVPYTVMFDPTGYWCLDGNGVRNSEMLIQNDDTNDYIEAIGNIYEDNLESKGE